jgi:hypothetical protein
MPIAAAPGNIMNVVAGASSPGTAIGFEAMAAPTGRALGNRAPVQLDELLSIRR